VLGPIDGPTHTGHEGGGTVDTGVMVPLLPGLPWLPGVPKAVAPVIPSGPGEVALFVPATVDSYPAGTFVTALGFAALATSTEPS
jgi:hypothetical protein